MTTASPVMEDPNVVELKVYPPKDSTQKESPPEFPPYTIQTTYAVDETQPSKLSLEVRLANARRVAEESLSGKANVLNKVLKQHAIPRGEDEVWNIHPRTGVVGNGEWNINLTAQTAVHHTAIGYDAAHAQGFWNKIEQRVELGDKAKLDKYVTLGPDVKLGPGVTVGYATKLEASVIAEERAVFRNFSEIGTSTKVGIAADIGDHVLIGPGCVLDKGVTVGEGAKIPAGQHLGQFCHIGNKVEIPERCEIGEQVHIDEGATIKPGVVIHSGTHVHKGVVVPENVNVGYATHLRDNVQIDSDPEHPTQIASYVQVGHETYLGPRVNVPENAWIGHNCHLARDVEILPTHDAAGESISIRPKIGPCSIIGAGEKVSTPECGLLAGTLLGNWREVFDSWPVEKQRAFNAERKEAIALGIRSGENTGTSPCDPAVLDPLIPQETLRTTFAEARTASLSANGTQNGTSHSIGLGQRLRRFFPGGRKDEMIKLNLKDL